MASVVSSTLPARRRLIRSVRRRLRFMKIGLLIWACLAIAACSPKAAAPPLPKTAFDLLQADASWTLAFGDAFLDGGSFTLSFIGSDGQIIHVWAQARRDATASAQRFYLKRTYNDPDAVDVLPDSPVEARVIELLNSHQRRPQLGIQDSYAKHFIAMLRDRKRSLPKEDEWLTDPK
jgi:hypothetical protein